MATPVLTDLDERFVRLLKAVAEAYIATAQPVGSQTIVNEAGFDVSSATIRNWFAELDDLGLLMQPHTSGGRIPTEQGWILYADSCLEPQTISKREQAQLLEAKNLSTDPIRSWKAVAKVVADLSDQAVYVSWQFADTYYTGLSQLFTQPEFKDWQRIISLSEILDRMDEALNQLRNQPFTTPQIRIGQQSPFGSLCSTIVCRQEPVVFGLLGPTRMNYQKNKSLLAAVHSLFL